MYKSLLLASFIIEFLSVVNSEPINPPGPGIGIMKEAKPGWVRFCSDDKHFDVFGNQCPSGFFWKSDLTIESNKWDCVCTRGPWRRNNKWCSSEEVKRFTQGDISCFEPESKLEGMLYLGDQHSAWDSGNPILLTSYTSGFTIRHEDFDNKWPLPSSRKNNDAGILIARPRDDWTVEDQNNPTLRLCLRAPPPTFDESIDGTYIYNVSMFFKGTNSDFKLVFTPTCFSWDKTDGKTWFEVIGESIDDKNMIVPQYDNSTASDACQKCMSIPIPHPPTTNVYGKPLKAAEKRAIYDLKHVGVLTSEVNLQTERLGLYWANRLLRDETDYVKENLQEVEILTRAAIMAYGTCDLNYIPKQFYEYFLLMFRRLLSESFKKYAPVSPINPEYYVKIKELMNKCKERTKLVEFEVTKNCPQQYKQYKSNNGTVAIPKGTDYDATPAKHDYLLEFIWRLKSFLHYNCFPEFQEDSLLHDLLQNQLESLFTEDILLRWFNPSKAFRMYEHIFKMHVDLKTTMNNFEKCVRVVHEKSKFPVWLKRPIDQPHRAQQSFFSRRRKRRQIEDNIEYADMALENIREKREDEPEIEDGGGGDETESSAVDETEGSAVDETEGNAVDETASSAVDKTEGNAVVETEGSGVDETEGSGDAETKGDEVDETEAVEGGESDNSTTVSDAEEDGKEAGSEDDDNSDKTVEDKPNKEISVEEESGESMYRDSSESDAGGLPDQKLDPVWNKFKISGNKGFVGACIESMSRFKELENKDMANCW